MIFEPQLFIDAFLIGLGLGFGAAIAVSAVALFMKQKFGEWP